MAGLGRYQRQRRADRQAAELRAGVEVSRGGAATQRAVAEGEVEDHGGGCGIPVYATLPLRGGPGSQAAAEPAMAGGQATTQLDGAAYLSSPPLALEMMASPMHAAAPGTELDERAHGLSLSLQTQGAGGGGLMAGMGGWSSPRAAQHQDAQDGMSPSSTAVASPTEAGQSREHVQALALQTIRRQMFHGMTRAFLVWSRYCELVRVDQVAQGEYRRLQGLFRFYCVHSVLAAVGMVGEDDVTGVMNDTARAGTAGGPPSTMPLASEDAMVARATVDAALGHGEGTSKRAPKNDFIDDFLDQKVKQAGERKLLT
jgi:hypothetical protein